MRAGPGALLSVLLWTGTACGQHPALRGRLAELSRLADEAQTRGAMTCAPRQLAIARAELYFATLELQQGFRSKATTHLDVAELNARAARNLTPAEGCDAPPRLELDGQAPGSPALEPPPLDSPPIEDEPAAPGAPPDDAALAAPPH